jgi:hypothetical protein
MDIAGATGLFAVLLALAGCQAGPPSRIEAQTGPSCPAPGSSVRFVRPLDRSSAGSRRYLASEFASEQGLCVSAAGDRRVVWNVAGRAVADGVRAEHAALQAQLTPLATGKSAQTYVNLPERVGLRSMQYQVTLAVLREERVKVPAGEFDAFLVEERERNSNCVAVWQAWVDRETLLPVRLHTETSNCFAPSESDLVAGRAAARSSRSE